MFLSRIEIFSILHLSERMIFVTIRKKIIGGFAVILVIGLILGIMGLVSTRLLTGMSHELYEMEETASGIATVLNAHNTWRQGLTEAVLEGKEFKGSLDPNACALGQWKNTQAAQNITDPIFLDLLKKMEEPHAYIHSEASVIVELIKSGRLEAAKRDLVDNILPRTAEVISLLTEMNNHYTSLREEKSAEIIAFGNVTTAIYSGLIVLAVIACIILALKIIKSIMNPLRNITMAAETIATGDLDVTVDYAVDDEIGTLAKSFQNLVETTKKQVAAAEALAAGNLAVEIEPRSQKDVMNFALKKMIGNLNDMFTEIRSAAQQVSIGSKQIADGAQALAQGSTEQASVVEELSASISEIANKTKQNADIAREAASLSGSIKDKAEKGSSQMEHMMGAVKEINQASVQIEKVMKVIDDIAFQTNILALNAAVEAARAGAAGKGFAVVADEVRNLAAKSAAAAKDTSSLIANSVSKADLGLRIATETSASLNEIVSGINRSAEIVEKIAYLSDQQAEATLQVNTGIDQVAQVIQQNSATAEESAAASEEMSGQSSMLEGLISRFRLKESDRSPSFAGSSFGSQAFGAPSYGAPSSGGSSYADQSFADQSFADQSFAQNWELPPAPKETFGAMSSSSGYDKY